LLKNIIRYTLLEAQGLCHWGISSPWRISSPLVETHH
jgi:hypothetical protein